MRLPQSILDSVCFSLTTPSELVRALGSECKEDEAREIERLYDLGLPPITSSEALSVMLGYNLGFVWSLLNRTSRYYRRFEIPKGDQARTIYAPQIALKSIQKWLANHFEKVWEPNENVFGFIKGKSHIQAASRHLSAQWVYSVDIKNYFPSIPKSRVCEALKSIGYSTDDSLKILSTLCCLSGGLVQGSPVSPILSNIVLQGIDVKLSEIAQSHGFVFTRYADDIVFSGQGEAPEDFRERIQSILISDGWKISERKIEYSRLPERLKVHGLLVHGTSLRLTKGYRNRIRAYRHLLKEEKITENVDEIAGHLNYASQIDDF